MQFTTTLKLEGQTATGIKVPREVWHILNIEGARPPETRERRIQTSVEMLREGRAR